MFDSSHARMCLIYADASRLPVVHVELLPDLPELPAEVCPH